MSTAWHRIVKTACASTLSLASMCLCACRPVGVLDPHGPVSSAERLILFNATGIMLVVVIPVIVLTLAFAWWFRAGNSHAVRRPDWAYSGQVELVVWAIPAMVVLLLAGVTWIGSHQLDPAAKLTAQTPPLRIQVISLDWRWLFIYPDQRVAALNQLVVPVGTPLEFVLTSATVMNAFFVPQLGTQIYTMPGMTTHLNLLADRAGDFAGFSSHFSGDGFSDMRFVVHAVSPQDFKTWLAAARDDHSVLDADTYARLIEPVANAAPGLYGDVAPALYDHILSVATLSSRNINPMER